MRTLGVYILTTTLLTKIGVVWLAALFLSLNAFGKNYYVDSEMGDDSFTGTSAVKLVGNAGAWRTLGRVNRERFSPNDRVLLRRGSKWREGLIISSDGGYRSPITYGAYGEGPNPIISAAEEVSSTIRGWDYRDNNHWSIPIKNKVKVVIFNNQELGRMVERLEEKNEWYWKNGVLHVYSEKKPESYYQSIEVGVRHVAIYLNNKSHIIIENIDVYGGSAQSTISEPGGNIAISNKSDNVVIRNLTSSLAHGRGVYIAGADNVLVENCTIKDIDSNDEHNTGDAITVTWWEPSSKRPHGITIRENHITGLIDRQGIALIDVKGFLIDSNIINFKVREPFLSWAVDIEPNRGYEQGVTQGIIKDNTISGYMHGIHAGNGEPDLSGDLVIENNRILSFDKKGRATGVVVRNMDVGNITLKNNVIKDYSYGILTRGVSSRLIGNAIVSSPELGKIGIEAKGYSDVSKNIVSGFDIGISVVGEGTINKVYKNNIFDYREYGLKTSWQEKVQLVSYCNFFSSASSRYHISSRKGDIISADYNSFYPDGANLFQLEGQDIDLKSWKMHTGVDKFSTIVLMHEYNLTKVFPETEVILYPSESELNSFRRNVSCAIQ